MKKIKLSKFEWVKKNIVIVPVVAAILAGTFTSVRYVLNLTDTIEANKSTIINIERDLKNQRDKLTDTQTRLSAADNLVATSVNLSSATVKSLCKLTMVCLFASIVSVKLNTYLTDVNVPASIAATTGTITMFFLTHSNLDNLIFFFIDVFHFRF